MVSPATCLNVGFVSVSVSSSRRSERRQPLQSGHCQGITASQEWESASACFESTNACGNHVLAQPTLALELRRADEIFLSSTGGGVIPIAARGGAAVSGRARGVFGPVSTQLQAAYWALHQDPHFSEPVCGMT